MKNRFKVRFAEVVLAGMVALNSFWLPGAINAQTVDGTDQSAQIYLPLVTNGSSTGSTEDPATTIPGQYIVVFHDDMVTAAGVSATAAELATNLGGKLLHTYDAALSGFALKLPTTVMTDALTTLQNDTRVSYIEPDRVVQLPPFEVGAVISEAIATEGSEALLQAASTDAVEAVQYNPPWGLDRVDQRALPLNQQYNYSLNGAGVWAYVIDTGIRLSHNEFQGRAVDGVDVVDGALPAADCHGHGTHVAGTIGGQTYGVAKGVRLIAVRVLNCSGEGTISGSVAGVNWVTTQRNNNRSIPMVANMSLGTPASSALDTAVQNSINAGVTYVVSAGNDNRDACNGSPARVGAALTVGATGSSDGRASFSNFGTCLDLFAPGVGVLSSIHTSNSASASYNGTSMASPHVAGAAALYLQSNPSATPSQVASAILGNSTPNVITNIGAGSSNRLLYISNATQQDSYQIVALHSNKCLDVTGGIAATANGTRIQQWSCLGTSQTNQIWRLIPVGNAFQVVAAHSGKCLDVTGGTGATGNDVIVQQWQCLGSGQTNQLWRLVSVGSRFQLVAVHSGKCLDVTGGTGATGNDVIVQQWSCLGSGQTNQLWELRRP
jgi:subtilisin family serine protease